MSPAKNRLRLRELKPAELPRLYPLVRLLNPELTRPQFDRRLKAMRKLDYRAVGVFEGKKLVGCSGYWLGVRFWCGNELDIDNFVIDPAYRNRGIGQLLLEWFEKKARARKVDLLVLDAYTTNTKAHRFYERAGFYPTGYHFTKIPGTREPMRGKKAS